MTYSCKNYTFYFRLYSLQQSGVLPLKVAKEDLYVLYFLFVWYSPNLKICSGAVERYDLIEDNH